MMWRIVSKVSGVLMITCMGFKVHAETSFKLGGLSMHWSEGNYRSCHRLVMVSHNDYFGGYFLNSFDDDSFVVGKTWSVQDSVFKFNLHGGLVYGYRKSSHCYKTQNEKTHESKIVCPAVSPEVVAHQVPLKPSIAIFGLGALVFSVNVDLP